MRRRYIHGFFALCLLFLSFCPTAFAQTKIRTDRYFPDSTQIFVAASSVDELRAKWRTTQLYETISDPKFAAFEQSLREQIESAWPNRLGLTFQDFAQLPSGEIGGGLIAPPGKRPGVAVMMDVTGNSQKVKEFLVRLIRQVTAEKLGEASQEKIAIGSRAVEATVLTFPPTAEYPEARRVYYVALSQVLVASDQKHLVEAILRKLAGETKGALAALPEY
ncbi:MAG: hypothetical protein HUK22_03255, partial [Thermoguttaceae bacterium]|nr:hypothetical protein [Thermoguttaceae bacterium]